MMMNFKIGMVFPGQGSQSVGMIADIADQFSEVKQTFDEASTVLAYDLWDVVQRGPVEKLDQTIYTQPALLAASYAIFRILSQKQSQRLKPVMFAGHSLGEYTALVSAGALTFADGIRLVAARGEYMQEAVPKQVGGMAAIIGLDEASVQLICKEAIREPTEILSPANFNSIGQIVIAGHLKAVKEAILLAKARGAKLAQLIPVSVPSHCELMKPAALRLRALLDTIHFKIPSVSIINNVDVKRYDTQESIRDGLMKQLYSPVQWVKTIQSFAASGVTHIVECGPGKVLSALNKRIDKKIACLTTFDRASLEQFLHLESEKNL